MVVPAPFFGTGTVGVSGSGPFFAVAAVVVAFACHVKIVKPLECRCIARREHLFVLNEVRVLHAAKRIEPAGVGVAKRRLAVLDMHVSVIGGKQVGRFSEVCEVRVVSFLRQLPPF